MIHMVEYCRPGVFFPETEGRRLETRSAEEAVEQAPYDAYCFVLYDLPDPPEVEAPENFRLVPQRVNVSERYYLGGRVYTEAEVERLTGTSGVLENMRANHWDRAIRCRTGNWQPFLRGDVVV